LINYQQMLKFKEHVTAAVGKTNTELFARLNAGVPGWPDEIDAIWAPTFIKGSSWRFTAPSPELTWTSDRNNMRMASPAILKRTVMILLLDVKECFAHRFNSDEREQANETEDAADLMEIGVGKEVLWFRTGPEVVVGRGSCEAVAAPPL
jgi:hypothetical protein